jgi:adenosylmethionine-8-amino-7-oxononanoate aminotransferase
MGAVFARESVVEPIAARGEDVMFYTYSNFPPACAVADKVLEIMEREDLVAAPRRWANI